MDFSPYSYEILRNVGGEGLSHPHLKNFGTVGKKNVAELFLVDPWSMDQDDQVVVLKVWCLGLNTPIHANWINALEPLLKDHSQGGLKCEVISH